MYVVRIVKDSKDPKGELLLRGNAWLYLVCCCLFGFPRHGIRVEFYRT